MTKRLTRAQIRAGLEAVPIEAVLLGAPTSERQLTSKQKRFAEAVAQGETKAGAYRRAYNSTGKPITASRRGQELCKNGAIQAQIEAYRLANEAARYATPAALRALVIERLTRHALDDEIPPAQRLRALELLGKVTEVAAFTERREIVRSTDAGTARERLLASLRAALKTDAVDVADIAGASDSAALLDDMSAAGDARAGDGQDTVVAQSGYKADTPPGELERAVSAPTAPHPPEAAASPAQPLLSNPHTESPDNSITFPQL